MSSENFTFWLQGFVELNGGAMPTELQWKMIQDHLALVFHKVTPTYPEYVPLPTSTPPWSNPYEITCGVPQKPEMRYCSVGVPLTTGHGDPPYNEGLDKLDGLPFPQPSC